MTEQKKSVVPKDEQPAEYETPTVETVVTANDLEREVQYAGTISRAPG
jgi:hypothetical protein